MKYIIYHKNGKTKIIKALDLTDAEIKADKFWKEWIDIKLFDHVEKFNEITSKKMGL